MEGGKTMRQSIFGWSGRIARIDLGASSVSTQDTMDYAGRFLGGRGIATRIYWEEVLPETGALEPENRLICMSGAIVGTGAHAPRA